MRSPRQTSPKMKATSDPVKALLDPEELSIKKATRIIEEDFIRRALKRTGGIARGQRSFWRSPTVPYCIRSRNSDWVIATIRRTKLDLSKMARWPIRVDAFRLCCVIPTPHSENQYVFEENH